MRRSGEPPGTGAPDAGGEPSGGGGEPAGSGGPPRVGQPDARATIAVGQPDARAPIDRRAPTDAGSELDDLVEHLPEGWSRHVVDGRSWGVTRVDRAGGRATTIEAEELGGPGRANANVWRTAAGTQLKPCEMPAEQVLGVLRRLRDADDASEDAGRAEGSGGARQP